MYSKLDDLIALAGLAFVMVGIYLWLGLSAAFILFGIILIYIGARLEIKGKRNEPDQATHTTIT